MPKPKLPRKIIKQENLWPTPYWYTQIWEFMRSKTRVTFNEDFTNYILNEADNKKSVIKSNKGGWQSELVNFKNDILGDKSFSYRCITGDTLSDFINDDDVNDIEALMSDIHDRFIDINHLGRGLQDFEERPSDQEIVDFFDITKNTFGLFECGKLLPIFEDPNKKSAALHIDSSTLKTGLKLSVYNDWNGVYRKASTTRGPFEIVGNSINCASSGNLGLP